MSFQPLAIEWSRPLPANDARPQGSVRPWLYAFPELREAEEQLREAFLHRLGAFDAALDRSAGPTDWDGVLFGQVSAYRYAKSLSDKVQLVATPRYHARGSDGPFNRSVLVVRSDDAAWGLEGLRDRRCAVGVNDQTSAMLVEATVASASRDGRFFAAVTRYPNWLSTLDAVIAGEADAALIDGVTYALLCRYRPGLARALRVLIWTTTGPGAPFVTSRHTAPGVVEEMRQALTAIERDTTLQAARNTLMLDGFNVLRPPYYRASLHLEQIADGLGYAELR